MSNPVGNNPNPVQQETQSWGLPSFVQSAGSYIAAPFSKLAAIVGYGTASSANQSPSLEGREVTPEDYEASALAQLAANALPVPSAVPEDLAAVSTGIAAQVPQMVEASEAEAVAAATPAVETETPPPVEEDAPQASETPKSEPNCIMKFLNLLLWLITFGQCGNEEKINETPQSETPQN